MFDTADIRQPSTDDMSLVRRGAGIAALRRQTTRDRPAAALDRSLYRRFGKRGLDLILVVASLIIALPLIVVLAAIVALDGRSPFFVQERVGQGGRVFRMIKLRSMIANAEAALDLHLAADPAAAREWAARQKLTDDPRVTRLGHFLRRTSLDELPQLFNVLKGDMSLVGPRPMMPSQTSLYEGDAYYALKPGITGLWQVSERNGCEFARRADYDQEYNRSLSLSLDVRTLLRTIVVVVRGTGC